MSNTSTNQEYLSSAVNNMSNIFTALNLMLATNKDTVDVRLTNTDGTYIDYTIPSISSINGRIKSVEELMSKIIDSSSSKFTYVDSNGNSKIINIDDNIDVQIPISGLSIPNETNTRNTDPTFGTSSTYSVVNINIPESSTSHRYEYLKYEITNIDSQSWSGIAGSTNVNVDNLNDLLATTSAKYSTYSSIVYPNISTNILTGSFTVEDISLDDVLTISSDVSSNRKRPVFTLDTMYYRNIDTLSDVHLRVGDKLTDGVSIFTIDFVDPSTRRIAMTGTSGRVPNLGRSSLHIYNDYVSSHSVEIPISSATRTVIFIRSINSNNTTSATWGDGIAFTTTDVANSAYSSGDIPKTEWGNVKSPTTPILSESMFSVVVVNNHKSDEVDSLKKLVSDKASIRNQISEIDSRIKSNSSRELIQERSALVENLASIATEINQMSVANSDISPKYRLFGVLPEFEQTELFEGGDVMQDVVHYNVQYRYVSKNGDVPDHFVDNDTNSVASKWQILKLRDRDKVINSDGSVEWLDNPTDTDNDNPRQVLIPISSNEGVQVKISSVSEVGYPASGISSDYSNIVTIYFPDDISTVDSLILDSNESDLMDIRINSMLNSLGIIDHINDEGGTAKHTSNDITTNIADDEGNVMTLSEVLTKTSSDISSIYSQISAGSPKYTMSLISPSGESIPLNNNSNHSIFDGYYTDKNPSKGDILESVYKLRIKNTGSVAMTMLSFIPGSRIALQDENYNGYATNIYEYRNFRKYWKSGTAIQSYSNSELVDEHDNNDFTRNIYPYKSSQISGQIAFTRHRSFTLQDELYGSDPDVSIFNATSYSIPEPFVWNGTVGSILGGGTLTSFCVHKDHPALTGDILSNYTSGGYPQSHVLNNEIYYPLFSHSPYMSDSESVIQSEFDSQNYSKIGFYDFDKYLIGKDTCGAYLFTRSYTPETSNVNKILYSEGRDIDPGDHIDIDVVFQYRMTDYYGAGSTGTGVVGGYGRSIGRTNIEFSKRIGLDMVIKHVGLISIDLSISAKYTRDTASGISSIVPSVSG